MHINALPTTLLSLSLAITMSLPVIAQAMPRVLVYTATAGFRHESIPTAIQTLGEQASAYNVSFQFSEYVPAFSPSP
jgi:hypothetical protein